MIERAVIPYIRYAHGLYNTIILLLFLYQGLLGIKIRRERMKGLTPTVGIVKRHRQFGPIISIVGITGFISGMITVFTDSGVFFVFRLHFITGLLISIFIVITYLASRTIKRRDSSWRTPHLVAGIILILLYFTQVLYGIAILF